MKIWTNLLLLVIPIISIAEIERCILEPILVESTVPKYPMPSGTTADLHTCHKGFVELEYIVKKDGTVSNPKVIESSLVKGCRNQSSSEDFFHETSKDAISQFKYSEQPESCKWSCTFTYEIE